MQCSSRVSACRRELNSHEAAKPRRISQPRWRSEDRKLQARDGISSVEVSNTKDEEPPCYFETRHCVGTIGLHSVCWAAAASLVAQAISCWRRLEPVAHNHLQRGAGGDCCVPAGVTRPWQARRQRCHRTALPNPSLKRSANGRPPGPVSRYGVHSLLPGPGVLPSSPA